MAQINNSGTQSESNEPLNITIEVFHPIKKKEWKTFVLKLKLAEMNSVRALREEILEQLGKQIVSFDLGFDVGYLFFAGSSFSPSDDIKCE